MKNKRMQTFMRNSLTTKKPREASPLSVMNGSRPAGGRRCCVHRIPTTCLAAAKEMFVQMLLLLLRGCPGWWRGGGGGSRAPTDSMTAAEVKGEL